MNAIEKLILDYEELINPTTLLDTQEKFDTFLNVPATEEDLKAFLAVCEDEELYEWCIDIKNKIDNCKDEKTQ